MRVRGMIPGFRVEGLGVRMKGCGLSVEGGGFRI